MNKIIRYIGEILVVFGTLIATFYISYLYYYTAYCAGSMVDRSYRSHCTYPSFESVAIAIGIALVVLGILIIINKKK